MNEFSNDSNFSDTQPVNSYTPWARRNGFSHAGLALIWLIIAFISFQLFAGLAVFAVVMIRMVNGGGNASSADAMDMMAQNMDVIFWGNSAGQILFLGLATWLFCRLHVQKSGRPRYLRLQGPVKTGASFALIIGLILAAQPAIWFLGWLNTFIPSPDFMESMQVQQMEMIETYLTGDGFIWVALFNIGIVPAVCEEILFRGYVQRSFEKSWNIWAAIVVSGLLFGAYHLQLANLLPLTAIGILLAYMTWTTESLYPAMIAHFVNNGASVLLGKYYPETAFSELTPESMPPLWMVAVSVAISAYLIYLLYTNKMKHSTKSRVPEYDK